MNIWHISDTHTYHNLLKIPLGIDMVIHSGDAATNGDSGKNANEILDFLDWYKSLPMRHKIFVPGNHDVSIERGLVRPELIRDMGITLLNMEQVNIEGMTIWGAPHTPSYGEGWAWNVARHKIHKLWSLIPRVDIVVTHGPPKGILDKSYNLSNELEMCGCKSLLNHIRRVKPLLHCFGHIHNMDDCINAGIYDDGVTTFSNGSCVTDREFGKVTSNGNILSKV